MKRFSVGSFTKRTTQYCTIVKVFCLSSFMCHFSFLKCANRFNLSVFDLLPSLPILNRLLLLLCHKKKSFRYWQHRHKKGITLKCVKNMIIYQKCLLPFSLFLLGLFMNSLHIGNGWRSFADILSIKSSCSFIYIFFLFSDRVLNERSTAMPLRNIKWKSRLFFVWLCESQAKMQSRTKH